MKIARGLLAVSLTAVLIGPVVLAQTALTTTAPIAPLQLKPPSSAPITVHMNDEPKNIYLAIGKAAGINVLFDPDYVSKHVQVDLTGVSLKDALRIVGEVTGTFYKASTPDTIFVAQNSAPKHNQYDDFEDHTFYLKNVSQPSDASEIQTTVRNLLPPDAKVFNVPTQDALVVRATPELLLATQRVINDLDLPRKAYRLTYTVTEMDGAKSVGTQHFDMLAVSGQVVTVKQGRKVPLATGSYNTTSTEKQAAGVQTQYSYQDVGLSFESTPTAMGDSVMLKANVERSGVAPEPSGVGAQDPIFTQSSLKGTFLLAPGKPSRIGSLDMPGTSHHLEIEATLEPLR